MPLSSRRRHKIPKTSAASTETSREYALPGQSWLEQLPLEILTQVFLYSDNTELVFVSKSVYQNLGINPSEWLVLEFFKPVDEDGTSLSNPKWILTQTVTER